MGILRPFGPADIGPPPPPPIDQDDDPATVMYYDNLHKQFDGELHRLTRLINNQKLSLSAVAKRQRAGLERIRKIVR